MKVYQEPTNLDRPTIRSFYQGGGA